jgi:hypothetical protein
LAADYVSLEYTKVVNEVGSFAVTLPGAFNMQMAQQDTRVAVFRQPVAGPRRLDFVGLVRRMTRRAANGTMTYTLRGPDLNHLLTRRIVAYAAGSAQADKASTFADNMIKAFVRENLGALASVAARNLTAYGFSVQADTSKGTNVTKASAWRNLLTTIKEIAEASQATPATAVYFGIVPAPPGWQCEFQTNILCWGNDHRYASGNRPVVFSLELGNLGEAMREVNALDERTYIYAGGQGQEAARLIQEASDATRIGQSPFNRCERFVNSSYTDDADQVLGQAYSELRDGKPKLAFDATIVDAGQTVYGRDYGFGDYVTCQFDGELIDCRIDRVSIGISGGQERIQFTLKSET